MSEWMYPEQPLEERCLQLEIMADEYRDAAEFEARVAARLAELCWVMSGLPFPCKACPARKYCMKITMPCKAVFLKYARLAVEEEMDV